MDETLNICLKFKLFQGVVKLYFKIMWILSGILAFVFVPLKITSDLNSLSFVQSGWFTGIFLVLVFSLFLLVKFSKINIENLEINKNIPLGIVSILVAGGFFLCISTYYYDKSLYDFEWQPIVMAVLSILSLMSFLLMAITFFTGKNLFSKASFFLFCPVFWFAFDMILFLSIQNDNSDIYDITFTASLALFFLYYTQVFSTSSKSNIAKLVLGIGVPSVILMLTKCVPLMINYINDSSLVTNVQSSTCIMESLVGIFIALAVIDAYKQVSKSSL